MSHKSKTNNYTDFFYHFFRNILLISAPLLIISAIVLSLPHSSAVNNSSSDYVSISLPSSCTLVTSGGNSHITNMVSGQLREDIGSTEINALCNDKNGYVVYAKGITQNSNHEPVLSSPIGPNYDIKTRNLPSGSGVNNSTWALKLNPVVNDYSPTVVDTYNNKYAPVPSDWTKVASRSSGTSTNPDISNSVKSAFTTTYAVYTTPSQPAGTYSGQVQFILLHPSTADKISPDINTAFFNANKSTVSVLDQETGEYGDFYKMQDMDSGICGSVVQDGEITAAKLVDIRDNKLYYVTKLKDGNCWMTQNLALDLEATPTNVAPLTSENTDLNDNSLSGAYSQAAGYAYENNVLTWRPANSTKTFSGTYVSGWTYSHGTLSSARKTDSAMSSHNATGNYYNWSAAIASNDSSAYNNTFGSTYNDISKNPQNSICPKGWRLPTISSVAAKDEFTTLNNLYNGGSTSSDAKLIISPLWFVRSGNVDYGPLNGFDVNGSYWSSTVTNGSSAYNLNFSSSNANPIRSNGRNYGFSLRCLAR